jgi:hypothetical protein
MNTYLVHCSILHRGDVAECVNNIPYLLFDLWSKLMMHNTVLIEENCEQHTCLASNLEITSAIGTKDDEWAFVLVFRIFMFSSQ